MKKGLFILSKRILVLIMLFLLIIPFLPETLANETQSEESETSDWVDLGVFRDTTYYRTFNRWKTEYKTVYLEGELPFDVVNTTNINLPSNVNVLYKTDERFGGRKRFRHHIL